MINTDRGMKFESDFPASATISAYGSAINQQAFAVISSSQQNLDGSTRVDLGASQEGQAVLRPGLAESATIEAIPNGSSHALLDANLDASRDSKSPGPINDSFQQPFDSIQQNSIVNKNGGLQEMG